MQQQLPPGLIYDKMCSVSIRDADKIGKLGMLLNEVNNYTSKYYHCGELQYQHRQLSLCAHNNPTRARLLYYCTLRRLNDYSQTV